MNRLRNLALVLAAACLLAACGADDDGAAPADPVTVTETVTASPTESPSASPSEEVDETATASSSPDASSPAASVPPSEQPADPDQPPRTYAEAEAHVAAATGGQQEVKRFESPDGQYYCVFANRYIPPGCEVLDGVSDPTACGGSPSQKVGRIEYTERGWTPFCNTDTIRMPGATKLPVGAVASWPALSMTCVLEQPGVTCLQTGNRQGFFFGSGRYQVF